MQAPEALKPAVAAAADPIVFDDEPLPAVTPEPVVPAKPVAAISENMRDDEPTRRAKDSITEMWTPLAAGPGTVMAPIEGPTMRRKPAPPAPAPRVAPLKIAAPQPAPADASSVRRRARPKKEPKPIQDEWGLYDPEQCGFAALLQRLESALEAEVEDKGESKRSAIMRR